MVRRGFIYPSAHGCAPATLTPTKNYDPPVCPEALATTPTHIKHIMCWHLPATPLRPRLGSSNTAPTKNYDPPRVPRGY